MYLIFIQLTFYSRKNILRSTLLRVNKAIYHEAVGYLYGNKFTFADTNALHDFLTAIGPRMRARLREIEVAEWGYSSAHKAMNYPAMSLLADAVNLERIWLNICHWEVRSMVAELCGVAQLIVPSAH